MQEDKRQKYVEHIAKMLVLAGYPAADAESSAATIMSLETSIAKVRCGAYIVLIQSLALLELMRRAALCDYYSVCDPQVASSAKRDASLTRAAKECKSPICAALTWRTAQYLRSYTNVQRRDIPRQYNPVAPDALPAGWDWPKVALRPWLLSSAMPCGASQENRIFKKIKCEGSRTATRLRGGEQYLSR
jgi:hypothetical protein